MKIKYVKNMETVDRFLYWIRERETIRIMKEGGKPKPWTNDKILQSYRFCNVRRMDDLVSRWLYDNWFLPKFDHPMMLVAVALGRFINKPSSLEAIGFPEKWEPRKWASILNAIKATGKPVFNSAYLVRAEPNEDKITSVIHRYVKPLYKDKPELDTTRMKNTWEIIHQYHGFGSFMAGQVVADLRWAIKGSWVDRKIWAPMGPGSQRGLNRLLNQDLNSGWSQDNFLVALRKVAEKCKSEIVSEVTNRLEMHDYQNCLCEFDKYERTLWEEGRPKSLYKGV